MNQEKLAEVARAICTPGKGILAADESTGTIAKRLASVKVENTLDNRFQYRELLFTTPEVEQFLSGVITYEETFLAHYQGGTDRLIDHLLSRGILVGIKTDHGVEDLEGDTDGAKFTKGLDTLMHRSLGFAKNGASFAKWRCVYQTRGTGLPPGKRSLQVNANTLARYARISQEAGLVPIVEPEVLMEGNHDLEAAELTLRQVLDTLYFHMRNLHDVYLPGTILKTNFVLPNMTIFQQMMDPSNPDQREKFARECAQLTLDVFSETLPKEVPGVVFLSGGMSEADATYMLNMINLLRNPEKHPWSLSFSYGRALQQSVLQTWSGDPNNVLPAQSMLQIRAQANSLASLGKLPQPEKS